MKKLYYLAPILAFVFMVFLMRSALVAQDVTTDDPCDLTVGGAISSVEQVCTGIGRDQVCYGNTEIDAVPRPQSVNFVFEEPGDNAAVSSVQSLYLSALDPQRDLWGIAQMRLLANLTQVPEDITMMLFGDVTVESAVAEVNAIDVTVNAEYDINIRSLPTTTALTVDAAYAGETLQAIARLEDSSWVRVRSQSPDATHIGWVAADLLDRDASGDLAALEVQSADAPYFGAMQALYYESGTDPACDNVISDGMLIQTPEGLARMTFLINEVNIELIDGGAGTTSLIEANVTEGLSLSMVTGSAEVTADGTTVTVAEGQRLTVPLTEALAPAAAPVPPVPLEFDISEALPAGIVTLVQESVSTLTTFADAQIETTTEVEMRPMNNTATPLPPLQTGGEIIPTNTHTPVPTATWTATSLPTVISTAVNVGCIDPALCETPVSIPTIPPEEGG